MGPEVVVSGGQPTTAADAPAGDMPGRATGESVGSEVRAPRGSGGSRTLPTLRSLARFAPRPSPAKNRSPIGLLTSMFTATTSLREGSAAGDRPWSRGSAAASSNCRLVKTQVQRTLHIPPTEGKGLRLHSVSVRICRPSSSAVLPGGAVFSFCPGEALVGRTRGCDPPACAN